MANLKEIRNRIASVSSTMQITSAMKMVSAAKLKKATDAISRMRPYSDKLTELIQNLSSSFESGDNDNSYVKVRPVNKILLVAITSNRGLCGGFNSNIIKVVKEIFNKNQDKKIEILSIGKKGTDLLSKKYKVISSHDDVFDNLNYENSSLIADLIMKAFSKKNTIIFSFCITVLKMQLLKSLQKNLTCQLFQNTILMKRNLWLTTFMSHLRKRLSTNYFQKL